MTDTTGKMIEEAFEEYRKRNFGPYAEYPIEALTYFSVGFRTAFRSQPTMGLSEEELAEIIYDNVWCNSSHSITGVYDASRAIIDRLTGRS